MGYLAQSMVADGTSGANWVAWLSSWMISPAFASLYVLLLQLFPTGRPPSARFRPLLRVSIATIIVATLIQPITGDKLDPYSDVSNPVGLLPAWSNGVLVSCEATLLLLSVVSLVVRFRRASGLERQQIGWYVLGAMLTALLFVTALVVYVFSSYIGDGLFAISGGMVIALPALGGIAMIRHRLYDVDLVLNRALVYGALSACVVGAYAGLVFGVGAIASGRGTVVAAAAAALCALAAAPLRSRLQRGVNRLLYGARDEPVMAVSDLGRRLEATLEPGAVLPTLVESVARALRLPYAAVELATSDGFVPGAHVGEPRGLPLEISLLSQGETVGRLLLSPRRAGEALTQADRDVLEILARQAGPAVQAVRLHADLQRSREQLVTAREEERRRLRRDLHDGLGPSLAAIAMQVGAAQSLDRQARSPARAARGRGAADPAGARRHPAARLRAAPARTRRSRAGLGAARARAALQHAARDGRRRCALRRAARRPGGRDLPHRERGDHQRLATWERDDLRRDDVLRRRPHARGAGRRGRPARRSGPASA